MYTTEEARAILVTIPGAGAFIPLLVIRLALLLGNISSLATQLSEHQGTVTLASQDSQPQVHRLWLWWPAPVHTYSRSMQIKHGHLSSKLKKDVT